MKLSTRGRYGLRVMTELAARYGQGPVLVEAIAAEQGISASYIHVLMGSLRSTGLVRSVRGRRGGYELARGPEAISALDVVQALEGSCAPVDCVTDRSVCPRQGSCPTREIWSELAKAIEGVLGRHSLSSLADRQRQQAGASRAGMYHI
jgi:Rrf2 family transcriptional regulator, cysteine metabolism repressor